MSEIIRTEQLAYTYPADPEETPIQALLGVDLTIERGSFVVILGHNGSGKSTLAKTFNGILLPSGGAVYIENMNTRDESLLLAIRQRVGMVFQNPDNQIVANIVEEDVAFAPENLGVPSKEIRKRVDDALRAVGMENFMLHAPHLLSGGQKQRIAIAGVIAMEPACIILDEATAMLDPVGRQEVLSTVHKLNREKQITVVLITHHMNEAEQADRVLIMDHGKLAIDGTPREVFAQPNRLRSMGLTVPDTIELLDHLRQEGFSVPLNALTVEECASTIQEAVKSSPQTAEKIKTVKTSIKQSEQLPSEQPENNNILQIQNLTHTYGIGTPFQRSAIEDLNFEIQKGEFLGIIGHTGSGKSTLIQHLNGLLKPTSGKILLNGKDIWAEPKKIRAVRFQVGLVFQYPEYQLFEETVYQDIAFGPKNMGKSGDELDYCIREAARLAGVRDDQLNKSPFELSGGQKRRVALAGVLAMEPDILILDEPTAGLDPAGRENLMANIRDYHRNQRRTILFVSHSMDEIAQNANRILVLKNGHILMDGTPHEIFAQADILLSAGLDVPQVTHIARRLREKDLPIDPAVYTVPDLKREILALKQDKQDRQKGR